MAEENKMTQDAEEVKEEVPAEEAPDTESVEETCEAASEETEEEAGEPAEEETETAEESQEETQKKSIFGKKKDKKDKKDTKIEELTDRLQRTMAEFDNFRKRTEKEKASMYVIGAKEIIEKMLPVVDNFERGLANAPEGDPFAEGIQMIYKQLMTTFDEMGVKVIETVGQQFDPNLHNAVMHVDDPEQEDNVIVEEFQKGYTYKDFVVRHSMVKVAN
ncbi:MAG: nucleotide exchange factor GrpE [Clostridiales bacterium]|nr:nucleotide exchange factor GrpE [Lachnospiraceae bacterium]MDD6618535.1 nucleotide exchange factor GrpE [Clostridiales bacterium]MDY4770064.1 nucleotide exchange factor GrpE [Lachnospiraceae bacterium]